MLHSTQFANSETYRHDNFDEHASDRPLVVQFCGDDPATLLAAARLVQHRCDAIDLNCGCPQGIARRGHYGAFLLDEPELIEAIVSTLSRARHQRPSRAVA
jgi:tRNA-dihydrouridine synthase 1